MRWKNGKYFVVTAWNGHYAPRMGAGGDDCRQPARLVFMIAVSLLLLWLAIARKFEPLLLLPIGFGGLLSNIPEAGLAMTALDTLLHNGSNDSIG